MYQEYLNNPSKLKGVVENTLKQKSVDIITDTERKRQVVQEAYADAPDNDIPQRSPGEVKRLTKSYKRHKATGTNNDDWEPKTEMGRARVDDTNSTDDDTWQDPDGDEDDCGCGDDDDDYDERDFEKADITEELLTEDQLIENIEKELKKAVKSKDVVEIEFKDGDSFDIDPETAEEILKKSKTRDLVKAGKNKNTFMNFLSKTLR